MTPAIEVEKLSCGYEERLILKNVSFSVRPQELMFIIGGSGCGKSTLLHCLIGLLEPHVGKIFYFGKNFMQASEEGRHAILKTFGVLYQNNALWSSMSVGENLSLALEQYTSLSREDREEVVALKLAQVGLPGVEDLYPRELSGGMKKRVALARALALDPKIVFFDEPSSGLDPLMSREIDELIREVRDTLGTTMVIISHQLSSIFGIADRIIMLDRETQGIIAKGDPRQLARESKDERVLRFLNNP
ncbi:MAG: ATP-binding cassette domain-containing protein [Chthoniobacterales bacterium]|nr:ATP-binding cassette domain-containing protein [Chthoniobacterales bacterium]